MMERMGLSTGQQILAFAAILGLWMLISYLRMAAFRKTKSNTPELTVKATVVSKSIRPGTYKAGRSVMGFSHVVCFVTEDGHELKLFTEEEEYGTMRIGMEGNLTYQGRYFLSFDVEE